MEWNKNWMSGAKEVIEVIVSFGLVLFFLFAMFLMAIRENGTHSQRVYWFGEKGAAIEEANNEIRRNKKD